MESISIDHGLDPVTILHSSPLEKQPSHAESQGITCSKGNKVQTQECILEPEQSVSSPGKDRNQGKVSIEKGRRDRVQGPSADQLGVVDHGASGGQGKTPYTSAAEGVPVAQLAVLPPDRVGESPLSVFHGGNDWASTDGLAAVLPSGEAQTLGTSALNPDSAYGEGRAQERPECKDHLPSKETFCYMNILSNEKNSVESISQNNILNESDIHFESAPSGTKPKIRNCHDEKLLENNKLPPEGQRDPRFTAKEEMSVCMEIERNEILQTGIINRQESGKATNGHIYNQARWQNNLQQIQQQPQQQQKQQQQLLPLQQDLELQQFQLQYQNQNHKQQQLQEEQYQYQQNSGNSCAKRTEDKLIENKTYASVATPAHIKKAPEVGNTIDCAIIVDRIMYSTIDDYVFAIDRAADQRAVIYIGQAPNNQTLVLAFVRMTEVARKLVQMGITIRGTWLKVSFLEEPATKFVVSGVLPFIRDEEIKEQLDKYGKLVYSNLRRIPAAVRAKVHNGILSFRREGFIVLERGKILPERLTILSQGKLFTLEISIDGPQCYKCGRRGHLAVRCSTTIDEDKEEEKKIKERGNLLAEAGQTISEDPEEEHNQGNWTKWTSHKKPQILNKNNTTNTTITTTTNVSTDVINKIRVNDEIQEENNRTSYKHLLSGDAKPKNERDKNARPGIRTGEKESKNSVNTKQDLMLYAVKALTALVPLPTNDEKNKVNSLQGNKIPRVEPTNTKVRSRARSVEGNTTHKGRHHIKDLHREDLTKNKAYQPKEFNTLSKTYSRSIKDIDFNREEIREINQNSTQNSDNRHNMARIITETRNKQNEKLSENQSDLQDNATHKRKENITIGSTIITQENSNKEEMRTEQEKEEEEEEGTEQLNEEDMELEEDLNEIQENKKECINKALNEPEVRKQILTQTGPVVIGIRICDSASEKTLEGATRIQPPKRSTIIQRSSRLPIRKDKYESETIHKSEDKMWAVIQHLMADTINKRTARRKELVRRYATQYPRLKQALEEVCTGDSILGKTSSGTYKRVTKLLEDIAMFDKTLKERNVAIGGRRAKVKENTQQLSVLNMNEQELNTSSEIESNSEEEIKKSKTTNKDRKKIKQLESSKELTRSDVRQFNTETVEEKTEKKLKKKKKETEHQKSIEDLNENQRQEPKKQEKQLKKELPNGTETVVKEKPLSTRT